jgi:hypothetical protein
MADDPAGAGVACRWCHEHPADQRCPYVKALEFDPTTNFVTRVEFLTPADFIREKPSAEPQDSGDYPKLGQE